MIRDLGIGSIRLDFLTPDLEAGLFGRSSLSRLQILFPAFMHSNNLFNPRLLSTGTFRPMTLLVQKEESLTCPFYLRRLVRTFIITSCIPCLAYRANDFFRASCPHISNWPWFCHSDENIANLEQRLPMFNCHVELQNGHIDLILFHLP